MGYLPDVAVRPRLDLNRPLRVGRLTSALASPAQAETVQSPVDRERLAPGTSLATIRLVVSSGAKPAHRRSPVPSAV